MRHYRKLILLVALTLGTLASTAAANNLSVGEQNVEVIWNNVLGGGKTAVGLIAGGTTIRCNLTLLGRFDSRTIRKLAIRVGYIRHVDVGAAGSSSSNCTGGTTTALTETLPWSVNYRSFGGILPDITLINFSISGLRLRMHPSGLTECLIGTTTTEPGLGTFTLERGRGLALRADESQRIRLGGGFVCEIAGSSQFEGTAAVRNLPNTADVTITLI